MSKPSPRKRTMEPRRRPARSRGSGGPKDGPIWLWGSHAVAAAKANPARHIHRLVTTANAARRLGLDGAEILQAKELERLLPRDAVHQGAALLADPLPSIELGELIEKGCERLAVLDQVSDPHNLGAIYRSAAAFGIGGLILQTRNAPEITGIAAKSAAGAIEQVPECRVVNVARTIETLAEAGYTVIGLAGEASFSIAEAMAGTGKVAIVLGSEGAGLRPAVAKACTMLARIPMSPVMESLNVSNAAAIAFYAAAAQHYS
ncbi:MAG: RNA methyltransferase [Pseudomonadota bacterium]